MKADRVFLLDGQGCIASVAQVVLGTSDEDALARASALVGGTPHEVWHRARRVDRPRCDGRDALGRDDLDERAPI